MIEVKDLNRYYGSFQALKDISFRIETGEVAGLLGLNGAGKTTCLRILTGYLSPSSGYTEIDGISVTDDPISVKGRIGYLPETPPLYPELSVKDYLQFVARMRGIQDSAFNEEFERVTSLTKLESVRHALIGSLSLGYRKRTGIAQALIGNPPVLILDEPISGLDPRQIVEIRSLIRNLAGKHTILISSHILNEVARTCDRVLIIHKGRLVSELKAGDMNDLEQKFMSITA
jgi:ABC-2 type transport system ATP-binding protein